MRTAFQVFWEEFKTKYQRQFVALIAFVAAGLWIVAPFTAKVGASLATGISLSAIVIILALVLDHLVDLKKPRATKFYSDKRNAENDTLSLISTGQARLIEYSARSVQSILSKLREVGAEIELLICHPTYTITNPAEQHFHSSSPEKQDFQKVKRICPALGELHRRVLGDYDKVKIRCYRTPGSIRGRNLGDRWIQVGWYTYDTRGKPEIYGPLQIWGEQNPVITAPVSSEEGQILRTMFNKVFESMWENSTPLTDVCGSCSEKAKCYGTEAIADEWLKRVS